MVVFDGTAFSAILTLFCRFSLEQMIFMMCITPFLDKVRFLYNIIIKESVVAAVGAVNM